jgi:hypothetical protein
MSSSSMGSPPLVQPGSSPYCFRRRRWEQASWDGLPDARSWNRPCMQPFRVPSHARGAPASTDFMPEVGRCKGKLVNSARNAAGVVI